MDSTPFIYGKIVEEESFINRTREFNQVKTNLVRGIHTMLMSPRRYGKSSLVNKVIGEIRDEYEDIKVVRISADEFNNLEEMYSQLIKKVMTEVETKVQKFINVSKRLLKGIVPKISIPVDGINNFEIALSYEDVERFEKEILDFPENLAKAKGIRIIICIDEFQAIVKFGQQNIIEAKLRNAWQHHQNVSYCLYGSQKHILSEIFDKRTAPFWNFGDKIYLKTIETKYWVPYIYTEFKKLDISITRKLAAQMADYLGGHPLYMQKWCDKIYNLRVSKINLNIANQALEDVVLVDDGQFVYMCERMTSIQMNLLKAIAGNEEHLTGEDTITKYRLFNKNNVTFNLKRLYEGDIIQKTKKYSDTNKIVQRVSYDFIDPIFKLWYRNKFLKIPPDMPKLL